MPDRQEPFIVCFSPMRFDLLFFITYKLLNDNKRIDGGQVYFIASFVTYFLQGIIPCLD